MMASCLLKNIPRERTTKAVEKKECGNASYSPGKRERGEHRVCLRGRTLWSFILFQDAVT